MLLHDQRLHVAAVGQAREFVARGLLAQSGQRLRQLGAVQARAMAQPRQAAGQDRHRRQHGGHEQEMSELDRRRVGQRVGGGLEGHHRAELAQALARLREQTTRDELTGLANRRHMDALIVQEHQRCTRSGQTFCLALLDIDRFKRVNEAHGYGCGDALLRALTQETLRHVRISDVLSRWGGGTFLLMMPDTRAALARGGLERLHQRLTALRATHDGASVGVTLAGGVAEHHAGEAVVQTLARVGQALAEAKAQGGDRVVSAA